MKKEKSIFIKITNAFSSILSSIFSFIFCLIFTPILLVYKIPFLIIRLIVSHFLIHFNRNLAKILTTRSSVFASDKIYTNPKWVLVSHNIYSTGSISLEEGTKLYSERIIEHRDKNGNISRPELKQYVTKYFGFSFWAHDYEFDVRNHIKAYKSSSKIVTTDELIKITQELIRKPFSPKRSPWEIYMVENYKEDDEDELSTVVITRLHHCLADGFSLISILNDLLQPKKDLKPELKFGNENKHGLMLALTNLASLIIGHFDAFNNLTRFYDPLSSWHPKKITRISNLAISPKIPIDYVKRVKNLNNTSFTAVIIECFVGALRKFMIEAGHEIPNEIHCQSPFPMPGHPGRKLRNHMSAVPIRLPVGLNDPKERLEAIEEEFSYLKKSLSPLGFFYIFKLAGLSSSLFIKPLFKNRNVGIMSNFPGPTEELYLNDHKLKSMIFCGGTGAGNCGMGFTCLSYYDSVRFFIGVDEEIVPASKLNPKKLSEYFLEELHILERMGEV